MKLKHAQQELKSKQAQVKKMDSGYKKDQDAFEAVQKCRDKLQAELTKLDYEGLHYNLLLCYSVTFTVTPCFSEPVNSRCL